MAQAEFEEKQYEAATNTEPARHGSNLFAPGQMIEHLIGYDAAILTQHPMFWREFPFSALRGDVDRVAREVFRHRGVQVTRMVICNVFIQYKRPEFLKRGAGRQKTTWNGESFFRFGVLEHQHNILLFQEGRLRSAVVCYAAPRFHRVQELFDHSTAGTVVESSIFIRPSELGSKAHSSIVTYAASGPKRFVHFSEPKEGAPSDLHELIREAVSTSAKENLWQAVTEWSDVIGELGKEYDYIGRLADSVGKYWDNLGEDYPSKGGDYFRKYFVGQVVARLNGTVWCPMYVAT